MAEIDPPYRLDPLQNPVNVKWGGAEGESIIGWFEAPVASGAPGAAWFESHVTNTAGDGAHEYAGAFNYATVGAGLIALTVVPVAAEFIALHQAYSDAYQAYLVGGGPFPKIPYVKATFTAPP